MTMLTRGMSAAAIALGLAVPVIAPVILPMTAPVQAEEAKTVNFGVISTESQQNLRKQWDPFLAAMSEKTGYEVRPFFASDYAGVIEGMRFGKVDIAWYGNKSAMEAVDRANGEIFVQTVDVEGNPGYWSLILAPKDSALNSVEDLLACDQSLDFGIGDPNSTSGFLVPMTFVFAANGVDPKECFATIRNANHETNAMAVAMGQVDAATNNTENLRRIEENDPAAFEKIKVIWKSPLIPSDPIVWRSDLAPETKGKLKDFFLTYGTEASSGDMAEEREVLAGLGWAPFRGSSNAQLLPIRVMEIAKEMGQVEADTGLADADKQAKLGELEAQKAELQKQIDDQPKS